MNLKLVTGIGWREDQGVWSCSLLYFDEEFNRIQLEPDSDISFKVLKGRFCIGFTRLSDVKYEEGSSETWKELRPCPFGVEVKRGIRCRECAFLDVTRACLRCNGMDCFAHPSMRKVCEDSIAYVYLASFGAGRIKAGVSKGRRIMKRWIEQGVDIAKRVLVGNGMLARRFEKQIQDEFGVLRLVKSDQKMNLIRNKMDIEKSLSLLEKFTGKVHETFPEAHLFHEKPRILLPYYRLPGIKKRPLELKIRDGLEVSGQVLGVKGPILLIKVRDQPFTINLNKLIGKKIETEKVSLTNTQTGLDRFLIEL